MPTTVSYLLTTPVGVLAAFAEAIPILAPPTIVREVSDSILLTVTTSAISLSTELLITILSPDE